MTTIPASVPVASVSLCSSREPSSKSREETAHTAAVSAADKSIHPPLPREDESRANSAQSVSCGDIKTRVVGVDRD